MMISLCCAMLAVAMNFSPRMVHSASGLDSYPDEYLERIAKTGVDSILVFISDPPDVTRTGRHEDIPALVARAAKHGIGVYAYADFPVKAAKLHPKEPGAREWYDETYGSIVKNAPGLKGLVCVGESVAFPYLDHRPTSFWWNRIPGGCRATSSNPVPDWADWLELVKSVTRQYRPDFEIVFWTYNWYRQPEEQRVALLEKIPADVSLLVTFEMGDRPVKRCWLDWSVQDYSITRPGPGTTFLSEAAVAKRRGIRLYSMTNTGGRTWDFGLLPYEPVPWRWKDRFEAIRRARATWGLCGLMESHHYGFRPNVISELATKVLADGYKPDQFEGILRSFAVRDYGEENADAVMGAWRDWSEAFLWHSAMAIDQYTVLRNGPVYPLCLPGAKLPAGIAWKHTNATFAFDPARLDGEIESAEKEIALLEKGCARLDGNARARDQWALGRFMLATVRTLRNAKRYYRAGLAKRTSEMRRIIDEEVANVKGCFDWIDVDPDIGWEPTMGRVVTRETLEWKLRQLESARAEAAAIGRDDPFPAAGYGTKESPYTLETGGVGFAAFSMRAVVAHAKAGDLRIRAEAPAGVETEIHPTCILFRADKSAPETFEIRLFAETNGHRSESVIPVKRLPPPEKAAFGDFRAVSFYTKPFCWFKGDEAGMPLARALRAYWEASGWIVDSGMVDFTGAIPYRTDPRNPICREAVDMNGVSLGGPCPSAELALGVDYFVKRLEASGHAAKIRGAKIALWDYEPYVLGPLTRGCWCDDCRKGFDATRTPVEILRDSEREWVAHAARQRAKIVETVAKAVKRINPDVKFALCTFPMAPSPDKDYEWLKRRGFDHRLYLGFVDIFANMNYPATDMFFGSLKRETAELPVENRMIISDGWYAEDRRDPAVVERQLRAAFEAGIRRPFVGPGLDQAQGELLRRCRRVMSDFAGTGLAWRGVHLDEARHFFGKETVKKVLDRMAENGLNVFHWHLVDDQGWRIQIDRYPNLVKRGAVRRIIPRKESPQPYWKEKTESGTYGPYFYTKDDIREIVAYAHARGIKVVPEIEIPGHETAACAAYPELSCFPGSLAGEDTFMHPSWRTKAVGKRVFCLGKDFTYRFLENVLDEVCELFPDEYVHLGGDETPIWNWKACTNCQARIRSLGLADEHALKHRAMRHFAEYVIAKGKRPVMWDDVTGGDLPKETVLMMWHEPEDAVRAIANGHDVVMTPNRSCYLDRAEHPTVEKVGAFDPLAGLSSEQRAHVLGAQCCNWTEGTLDEADLLDKMWPRAMAFGNLPKAALFAAAELAKYVKAITGGAAPRATFAIDASMDAKHDEYRVKSEGDVIRFTGANARALLYGVYDLLGRRGGCRWFWDGDVVPKREALDFSGVDIHEKSRFEYRGYRYFAHRGLTRFQAEHWGLADWKREIDWMLKSRLNMFFIRVGMDDLFQRAFPEYCKYPDASKELPGQVFGDGFDNRNLFWSLEFRGKLRQDLQRYAAERGMIIPEDFGTITHWYTRTPEDFIENAKPDFLPEPERGYAARKSGKVWDVTQDKWLDAYWRLTETSIREYGRPGYLHTIGFGERHMSDDPKENRRIKTDMTARMIAKAAKEQPDSKIFFAGWDFYSTWNPKDISAYLKTLDPNRVIILDYEGDAYEKPHAKTGFRSPPTTWGLYGGSFPYTFGTFFYEAQSDIHTDYDFVAARQRLVEDDPMCVGYVLWPEASHTDILQLRNFTDNAWRPVHRTTDELVDAFCADRYGTNAAAFASLWKKTIPMSVKVSGEGRWRYNLGIQVMRRIVDEPVRKSGSLNRRAQWDRFDRAVYRDAAAVFDGLADVAWEGEAVRRDTIDLARTVMDRLAVQAVSDAMQAWFDWKEGKAEPGFVRLRGREAVALAKLLAKVLALHTDHSLCDSYDRLDKVERIRYPGFAQTLLDNVLNFYCPSHQAELAEHCYVPALERLFAQVDGLLAKGDRAAKLTSAPMNAVRTELLKTPLLSLRPTLPRTPQSYRAVMRECAAAARRFQVPLFTVAPVGGAPRIHVDGRPVNGMCALPKPGLGPEEATFSMRDFSGLGVRFFSDIWWAKGSKNDWWLGVGRYDWAAFDRRVKGLLDATADGWIFPRLKMDPPDWYAKAHPEVLRANEAKPDSPEWRALYRRMVTDVVDHVESSLYADRVMGYHVGALHGSEWMVYPWPKDELPAVTHAPNDTLPPLETTAGRRAYQRRRADAVADALLDSARLVKELTGGRKLVGAFFGYLGCPDHESFARVVRSPDVDFFSSPGSYGHRRAGQSGRFQASCVSTFGLHGKLYWDESDIRTWHAQTKAAYRCATPEESVGAIKRNLGYSLTGGWETWWFLLAGNDTFHDEEMLAPIRTAWHEETATLASASPRQADVAVFTAMDEYSTSTIAERRGAPIRSACRGGFHNEVMPYSGVAYDAYELSDIEDPRLPDYKVYVFTDAFTLSEERRAAIERRVRRAGKTAIWFYAPGYYRNGGGSATNVTDLTGVAIAENYPAAQGDFVRTFTVTDPAGNVKERDGWRSVYYPLPPSVGELRQALKDAGAHLWTETPEVVAAGRGYLMVHAATDGEKTICLPSACDVTELYGTAEPRKGVRSFRDMFAKGETRIYRLKPDSGK